MRCWEPLWTTSHVHPVSFLSLMYVKYLFIKKMKDFQTNLALCDSHWHLSVGKGLQYKVISKALTLRWTTMTVIIYKWRKTWNSGEPRSDWPTKLLQESINDSFRRLEKNPEKQLNTPFTSVSVRVHDSTIRMRLDKNGIHGTAPR